MPKLTTLGRLQLGLSGALAVLLVVTLTTAGRADKASDRIVSIGGSVTEIVYALGEQHRLVARDTTSNYPAEALELPDVGYIRRLSPEGLLSVSPDLILAEEGAGPPEALETLHASRVKIAEIPLGFDRQAVHTKILAVADAIGVPERGRVLAEQVDAAIAGALSTSQGLEDKRVLFVLTLQGGRVMAAGANTAADGVIQMAGARNALDGFEGYKPVTDEAIIQSQAEVILMMESNGGMRADDTAVFAHPAIAATPAGQARALIRMDGMKLLGFSVRTGEAIADLSDTLRKTGH